MLSFPYIMNIPIIYLFVSNDYLPVTVTERSKTCTVFVRSEAEIVGSNPTQGMRFVCVCVFLCLGRGLATGQSLPTVCGMIKRTKENLDTRIWVQEERMKKNYHNGINNILIWLKIPNKMLSSHFYNFTNGNVSPTTFLH
jgi:hypothetical protein